LTVSLPHNAAKTKNGAAFWRTVKKSIPAGSPEFRCLFLVFFCKQEVLFSNIQTMIVRTERPASLANVSAVLFVRDPFGPSSCFCSGADVGAAAAAGF
jgi:hypothetical protein